MDVVVTVANLSKNRVEYKSIKDFSYEEFCNWIWISCNYIPFMSLAKVDGFEYADGGLGCVVPIREAILRGATEVDAIASHESNLHAMDLQVFQQQMAEVYYQVDTLYNQFGSEEEHIMITNEKAEKISRREVF